MCGAMLNRKRALRSTWSLSVVQTPKRASSSTTASSKQSWISGTPPQPGCSRTERQVFLYVRAAEKGALVETVRREPSEWRRKSTGLLQLWTEGGVAARSSRTLK